MNIVALVTVRSASKRFPDKFNADIFGKPMMVRVAERVNKAKMVNEVVIATVINDWKVIRACYVNHLKVFSGSQDDICDRLYHAAEENKADWVVRIWGDSPLVDPEIIDKTVNYALKYNADYCYTDGVPGGQMVAVLPFRTLEKTHNELTDPHYREWYHNYFKEVNAGYNTYGMKLVPDRSHINLSVDTPEDLSRIKNIISLQEALDESS
jgi:spore coat polysaccharide biosynthesis protein SpsF (cytidylyltransferase family)